MKGMYRKQAKKIIAGARLLVVCHAFLDLLVQEVLAGLSRSSALAS
jgi:hypothetical protein